jgi:hypothetical protein
MHSSPPINRREYLTLVVLACALLGGGVYLTRAYVMDDALITLRYSFNLARHGEAIWNQGDATNPSRGYTSVLWMLVNAVPALFTENKDLLVLSCKWMGLVPLAALVLPLVGAISRMPVPRSFRIGVILAVFSQVVYGFHCNSGMETLLFASLILLTIVTYAQGGRSVHAYLLGTLAFLTRPEGALVVALMILWDLRQRRVRQAALGCACFSLTALCVGLWLQSVYGSVLPNAFYVKQGYGSLRSLKFTVSFLVQIALPYLPLAAYSVYRLKDSSSRYCWSAAALFTAYYITVTPQMNVLSRYQWPVLLLLIGAALPALRQLGEGITAPGWTRHRQLAAATLALVGLVNIRSAWLAVPFAGVAGSQQQSLITLGKALAEHRDEERWMAYGDVGAICYYSDWNTYDTVGLNTWPIATGSVTPVEVYGYRHTDLVLLNGGKVRWAMSQQAYREMDSRLRRLGYRYAGSVPIGSTSARERWEVLLFARDLPRARRVLRSVQAALHRPASPVSLLPPRGERPAEGHSGEPL